MAGFLPGDPSHHGMVESGPYNFSHEKTEERDRYGSNWYFIRKEIEENSPSRRDGIDLKKETYFRKSYCTFLQDLGIRLKVPQVTIATAIMFCHRFFLRQSHAKNDRRTIATVCMFLAGKVEETPHPLKDVILVSYEIIHKKDHAAVQRIKQKEVYEQQKELILVGERVVLATLGFDLNVHHPYKPLVEAIKKFKVAQNALAQVAWNFVNDGLRTSLCLQFKPHHIAAGAIFLAAKFLKVKLPSDGENVWRKEFDVTPRQLEEVSNQMLELYEQSRVAPPPASHGSEVEGSGGGANNNQRAPAKTPEPASSVNGYSQATVKQGGTGARVDSYSGPQRSITHNQSEVYGSIETKNGALDYKEVDSVGKEGRQELPLEYGERNETGKVIEQREKPSTSIGGQSDTGGGKGALGGPTDAMKKIDKEKVKAALEKRRKSRGDVTRKPDLLDDYDLLERELENGVELAVAEDEKMKRERRQQRISSSMMPSYGLETDEMGEIGSSSRRRSASFDSGEGHRSEAVEADNNTEEGELSSLDAPPRDYNSPKPRKRKLAETTSPQGKDSRLDYYAAERDHHRGYRQEPHHV